MSERVGWRRVCAVGDLVPDRGRAALVDDEQVAVFLLADTGRVHAVAHLDPFSGANVMARGLVGTRGERPTVASPMHKQVFDLRTGECLDDPTVRLRVWPARVTDGWVEVRP
ncbi:nitrite reductase small subunit NirD [Polymorphospora sp. NPDC051019]|uniref:nitrite reductase small subunit NirD n=1 Tax=Polymorphospora sp. NPDC051019 TaxID=3155725 RepID=UPI00341724A5